MAEMKVDVEGGVSLTGSDGTPISSINYGGVNSMSVAVGVANAQVSLSFAPGDQVGSSVTYGVSYPVWTVYNVSSGTLTGTVHLEVSPNGTNWYDVASGVVPAGGTFQSTATVAAAYARANLTGATGTGSITSRIMAA